MPKLTDSSIFFFGLSCFVFPTTSRPSTLSKTKNKEPLSQYLNDTATEHLAADYQLYNYIYGRHRALKTRFRINYSKFSNPITPTRLTPNRRQQIEHKLRYFQWPSRFGRVTDATPLERCENGWVGWLVVRFMMALFSSQIIRATRHLLFYFVLAS